MTNLTQLRKTLPELKAAIDGITRNDSAAAINELRRTLRQTTQESDALWMQDVRTQQAAVEEKLEKRQHPFEEDELVYAATARCRCGAGLAHPKHVGPYGSWHCSAVLKDVKLEIHPDHDEPKPFTFWKVKSETQPSAGGATTRPAKPAEPEPAPEVLDGGKP